MENGQAYQIRVEGQLEARWSDWFSGMSITIEDQGDPRPTTTIRGVVADQSTLRGILTRIWDLNLSLISVTRLEVHEGKTGGKRE